MNLKDFLTNKESPPELFWALVIEKGLVQSGIWYIGEGTAEVIGIGAGIPWESEDELVEATDAALSSAIQKLPEDYPEPQKTVFGVSTSWVKDGEISPENLIKIKKLCTELSLTPVGFVVLPEAIAHLYKSEEGSPLNAIVLKSGSENLELSVFKLGELAGTTEVSRSVSLVDDVIEGLSRFDGVSPLPTRFIVYDGKEGELEEVKQTLIQANWGEGKVSFLHTPQVEILSTDRKVLATALAGGAEIGDVTSVVTPEEEGEEDQVVEEKPEEKQEEQKPVSAEAMGFAVGEDISSMKKEDIQNVMPMEPPPPVATLPSQPSPVNVANSMPQRQSVNYLAKSKILFHSFSKIFSKANPGSPRTNKGLIAILAVLGLGFVAVSILWWFVQTAKVTIYVTPKRSEENVQITFDSGGQSDQGNGIIPAKVLTDQVSGEKTKTTTGTKLIGNKATGSVQIANGNGAAINLAAGTSLTSSSGFKFVTNNEASVSGQLLPGSPGTATVNVTAYDIGSQYNLAKGEVFSVGNYSKALVAATSTGDFSGGSSQQISAVNKDDQLNLENDLKNELAQNAKSDLSAKVADN
ncbi:MAG: baseplate J/gp47 family protein, partial [Vicinamibacterales bacterium]